MSTDDKMLFSDEQLAFTLFVYPCLILAYMGEAAYLSQHKEDLQSSFYKAIPGRCQLLYLSNQDIIMIIISISMHTIFFC